MPGPLVVAPTNLYCVQQDVENMLGAEGLLNKIDDFGNRSITTTEQQAITDAITDATVDIDFCCGQRYSPTWLATSALINRWATILAAYAVCARRGEDPPASLEARMLDVKEKLESIQNGTNNIPGLPMRRIMAPVWSHTRVRIDYQFRCLRVETRNSSQKPADSLPQNIDYQELATPERQ